MELFIGPPPGADGTITVTGEEHRHLARVHRAQEGDEVLVTDGRGITYLCEVRAVTMEGTVCVPVRLLVDHNEPRRVVTLAVAPLKNPAKLDWVIEKATELGVTQFLPVRTARTLVPSVRADRLQRLAVAATKQCARSRVPPVLELMTFLDAVDALQRETLLVLHETAPVDATPERIVSTLAPTAPVTIFVGPEGGFTDEEAAAAAELGAHLVSLGSRRLRAETAAIAALARLAL